MRLREIALLEYGVRSFPGTGLGLFRQAQYVFIADALHNISDREAQEFLTNWFVDIFKKDSVKFKEDVFRRAVENGINSDKPVVFQSRHFFYLAHFVSQIEDMNIKEFVCNWLADHIGETNPKFNAARWKEFCGLEITPTEKKLSSGVRRKYVPGEGYSWPKWYQDHLDQTGQYHDPKTGERG